MKPIKRHVFEFPTVNSGEGLSLTTEFFWNGDPVPEGIFTNQELTLMSYGNSASLNLSGTQLTPELLRRLADELEEAKVAAMRTTCVGTPTRKIEVAMPVTLKTLCTMLDAESRELMSGLLRKGYMKRIHDFLNEEEIAAVADITEVEISIKTS